MPSRRSRAPSAVCCPAPVSAGPQQSSAISASWYSKDLAARATMRKLSLGAAFNFGQPAPGYKQPAEPVPGAWQIRFFAAYADAEVLRGLFTTSRAGPVLALEAASLFGVQHSAASLAASPKRLAWLRHALAARGSRPTSWALAADPPPAQGTDTLVLTLDHLRQYTTGTTHLKFTSAAGAPYLSQALAALQPTLTFPNLTTLDLSVIPTALPAPTTLPRLTALSLCVPDVDDPAAEVLLFSSAAPYLPQLVSLTLSKANDQLFAGHVWPVLFTAQSTTRTMTSVSVAAVLDSALVRLLLDHAPDVNRVSVDRVSLGDEVDLSNKQWAVRELTIMTRNSQCTRHLARLPLSSGHTLTILCEACSCQVEGLQGLAAAVRERLPHWRIRTVRDSSLMRVLLRPAPGLQAVSQPAALQGVIEQLANVEAPRSRLALHGWLWTVELAQSVASALAPRPGMGVNVGDEGPLTDVALRALTHLGPRVGRLGVRGITLQEDHGHAEWPWHTFHVRAPVSVHDAVFLPARDPAVPRGTICCQAVQLHARKETKERVDFMCKRLNGLQWALWSSGDTLRIELLHDSNIEDPVTAMKTQITLLQHVHVAHGIPVTVALVGWPMTCEAMQVLQELPHMGSTLDLSTCTFPLPASEYTQLARSVHFGYAEWQLGASCSVAVLCNVCMGIEQYRERWGVPPVRLVWPGHTGEQEAVGKHVILTH